LPLWAESGISVSPYEGGIDLNFGRVSSSTTVTKEVKVRITSNLGKQYQVFQRLEGGLVNERGVILNPSAVVFSTLRGSNSTGSLYQEEPVGLSYNDQLLYVSNFQGDSDSFFVVYTFRGERLNAYGQFLGKIVYTLRPLGEGEEKIAILNVYLKKIKPGKSGPLSWKGGVYYRRRGCEAKCLFRLRSGGAAYFQFGGYLPS